MAPHPDPREYPTRPWVGVGAIVLRGGQVLLIKRAKPPEAGRWSLPGGTLELGETSAEAAIREVAEETGIKAEAVGILTAVDRVDRDQAGKVRYHYLLVDVVARYLSGDPVAADDAADAQWFDLDKLDDMAIWDETKRVIREAAEKHGHDP